MNRGLFIADLLVRQELQKSATVADAAANVGRGIVGAIRGGGRVIQKGFSEAGAQAAKDIGGGSGRVVGGLISAVPKAAVGGTALYGANQMAGNPVGQYVELKRQQLAQRLQNSQARQYQGVYY